MVLYPLALARLKSSLRVFLFIVSPLCDESVIGEEVAHGGMPVVGDDVVSACVYECLDALFGVVVVALVQDDGRVMSVTHGPSSLPSP